MKTERKYLVGLYRFQRLMQVAVVSRAMPNSAAWLCPPAERIKWEVLAEDIEASIDALREAYKALVLRDKVFRQLVETHPWDTASGRDRETHFYQVLEPLSEQAAKPYTILRDAAIMICKATRNTYSALLNAGAAGEEEEKRPLPAPDSMSIPHTIPHPALLPPLLKAS